MKIVWIYQLSYQTILYSILFQSNKTLRYQGNSRDSSSNANRRGIGETKLNSALPSSQQSNTIRQPSTTIDGTGLSRQGKILHINRVFYRNFSSTIVVPNFVLYILIQVHRFKEMSLKTHKRFLKLHALQAQAFQDQVAQVQDCQLLQQEEYLNLVQAHYREVEPLLQGHKDIHILTNTARLF